MKNFQVEDKETGKKYWISRSVAVSVAIYGIDDSGNYWFLSEKRGPGCPDNVGKWTFPCGYLDFDETLKEGAAREIYEETGLRINTRFLEFYGIRDDPKKENRQNIVIRYILGIPLEELKEVLSSGEINTRTQERGGEGNECSEIKLLRLKDTKNWAFSHDEFAKSIMRDGRGIASWRYSWRAKDDSLETNPTVQSKGQKCNLLRRFWGWVWETWFSKA